MIGESDCFRSIKYGFFFFILVKWIAFTDWVHLAAKLKYLILLYTLKNEYHILIWQISQYESNFEKFSWWMFNWASDIKYLNIYIIVEIANLERKQILLLGFNNQLIHLSMSNNHIPTFVSLAQNYDRYSSNGTLKF